MLINQKSEDLQKQALAYLTDADIKLRNTILAIALQAKPSLKSIIVVLIIAAISSLQIISNSDNKKRAQLSSAC